MSYTPETKPVHEQEPCGCIGLGFAVHFCPLHTAAPELVAACERTLTMLTHLTTVQYSRGGDREMRDILTAALARVKRE